jgi:hypothetical protein
MNISALSNEQRALAVQRLTALWAFTESGLGGVLHALKLPFTGLMVGGLAVILITFIGYFSNGRYKQILQSLFIVLLVKAAVSPHTPFPAYVAVSFQAVAGFIIFSLMRINFISILLFSLAAMIQSAIQKLIILTFFFGASFWKAANELGNYIAKQFSITTLEGSYWLVGLYLGIYITGAIVIAFVAYNTIKRFSLDHQPQQFDLNFSVQLQPNKRANKKVYSILIFFAFLSLIFLLLPTNGKVSFSLLYTFIWTITAIVFWYIVLNPLLTKLILKILRQRESAYTNQVNSTFLFLPALQQIAVYSWVKSKNVPGIRISNFILLLINYTLTYTEPVETAQEFKNTQ